MEDVNFVSVPEQRNYDGIVFPAVISPKKGKIQSISEACKWMAANQELLHNLALQHGAILFRDFPVESPEDFAAVVADGLGIENLPYVGGAAVRTNVVGDRVFTANESPPSEPIPFHHEMAQVPHPPSDIFFYCQVAPQVGGATPILISNRVYQRVAEAFPDFMAAIESQGIRYVRTMPSVDDPASAIGRSWKSTFQCTTPAEAEDKMRSVGTTWEWLPNGDLRTVTAVMPAIRTDARSGRKTFFNSMVAAYTGWKDVRNDPLKAVVLADHSLLDPKAMAGVSAIMQEEAVAVPWKERDVMFIDNRLVMHSRQPFEPPRRILASLGK